MASAQVPSAREIRRSRARATTEENAKSQKKGKTKGKVDTDLQDEENGARRIPSRKRLSSGGLFRKSQKKLTDRPSLVRSHTLDAFFSSRRRKKISNGCDNVLSSTTPLQGQNSRDRRHSTPINASVPKSEVNQDVEVFSNREDAQQIIQPDQENENIRTNYRSGELDSDDCQLKSERDISDKNKISYPGDRDEVHDPSFNMCSAGVANDKLSKFQLPSHDIFSRNAQSRNPIKRSKSELSRQSLPVPSQNDSLRTNFESELQSQGVFNEYQKLNKKVDSGSNSTFKEIKESPKKLKEFKSSLLGVFDDQKEVDKVNNDKQCLNINKEKWNQKSRSSSRRFSLPSRIQDFYVGTAENNEPLTDIISKWQDFERDLGKDSEDKIFVAQQDYKSKENRKPRKKSLPHVFLNHHFSNSESCHRQKPLSSIIPKRTKSLPGLSELNNSNMEEGFDNKVIFKSTSVDSLNIARPIRVLDERTREEIENEFGYFSKATTDSLSFDNKNSINTVTNTDLNEEIQEITRCVESVIQDFYKHKEQCDHTSVSYEHEQFSHAIPDECANTSPVNNSMGAFSELQLGLEKEELKGLGTLATSLEDQEINSKRKLSSGELGQDILSESEDKIVPLTEIERSPEFSSLLENSISLEQTTNCIYDCETKDNYPEPVEPQKEDYNGDELLRNDHPRTEIKQETLHPLTTQEKNKEASENKQPVLLTEHTKTFSGIGNAKDNATKESDALSNVAAERELMLHPGSLGDDQTNNYPLLDQPAVEKLKAGEEETISSHEKSVVNVSKAIKDDDNNTPFCVTNLLNSEQKIANKTILLPKENAEKQSKEFPQHQGSETTSEGMPTVKRDEEKSKYVENPRVSLYCVIQSVVEELFCQVQDLNSKTDITKDIVSSVSVEKSVAESALVQNENRKVVEKINDAEGGSSIDTRQTQNDIIELCVSSDDASVSETTGHPMEEPSPSDVKNTMIILKKTKELEEQASKVEDREIKDKTTAENVVTSWHDEEPNSKNLELNPECEGSDSGEFENEVDEILENVTDFNDAESETSDTFTNHLLLGSEREHFVNSMDTLHDNATADFEAIESDKGQKCGSVYPVENGAIQNIFTQHEENKVSSDILRPEMQNSNYSECSLSAENPDFNEEAQSLDELDHAMEHLTSLNVANDMQKPSDSENLYSCETEIKKEKVEDNQQHSKLENTIKENAILTLDISKLEPDLDEGKSREIDNLANAVEISHEIIEKDHVKTVENCFGFSDKLTKESPEKIEIDSVDGIQLPKIIVPCETDETATTCTEKKSNEEDGTTMRQEIKVEPEKHAELDNACNLLQNSHAECINEGNKNIRKPLELELDENESCESVDICDGSPIERLSQELDAFDISPFNRPRVYTLPLTHHMEKIVEAPCEMSPDIEKKEFPAVFSKSLSADILQLRKTGSLCRDARKRKLGKTQRSFSAPSTTQGGSTKHDLYPLREEPEAVELSMEDRLKLFEKLLSKSLKTVLEPDFTRSKSPLHRAIAKERFDCVEFLIECGVDINANDESGWPPLHVAVTRGSFDCAVFLVEAGADLGGYTDLVMKEYKRLRRLVYCRTI